MGDQAVFCGFGLQACHLGIRAKKAVIQPATTIAEAKAQTEEKTGGEEQAKTEPTP